MSAMDWSASRARAPASRPLIALVALIAACDVAAALAGFGHRWAWWDYRTGFSILRWAAYIAAGAGAVALIAFLAAAVYKHATNTLLALAGAILAAALVLPAWQLQRTGQAVPRINDITTDIDDPPAFVAVAELRRDAPNPAAYAGPAAAAEQKTAYADIRPVRLPVAPAEAYQRALAAARDMGWDIVAEAPAEGRIEATDATFWFGFKDDIVVRVAPAPGGSRIDVRSKSRVGRNDFGTNAKRIRAYIRKLEAPA